jgi:hypothetical protein
LLNVLLQLANKNGIQNKKKIIVAVNSNKVLFFHSTHSLRVSARNRHLQVNSIVSYEASYAFLTVTDALKMMQSENSNSHHTT